MLAGGASRGVTTRGMVVREKVRPQVAELARDPVMEERDRRADDEDDATQDERGGFDGGHGFSCFRLATRSRRVSGQLPE
jgi:hypothetical protein